MSWMRNRENPKYSEGKQSNCCQRENMAEEHEMWLCIMGPISVSQEQDKVLEVQAWLVYLVAFLWYIEKFDLI